MIAELANKMNQRPTKKQKELLNFIEDFIKLNGYGPSYREIMRALDYKSVSTVATHVDGLIARGQLRKKDNSARTLEVVKNTEFKTSADLSISVGPSVCSEIKNKISELQNSDEDRSADIEVLKKALNIFGCDDEH